MTHSARAKRLASRLLRGGKNALAVRSHYRRLRLGAEGAAAADLLDNAVALAAAEPPPRSNGLVISLWVSVGDAASSKLERLLDSFLAQPKGLAELLFGDFPQTNKAALDWAERKRGVEGVKIVRAARAAPDVASAPWIGRLDPDGVLAPHALARLASALEGFAGGICLYTDEIVIDAAARPRRALLKPAFDPVLLSELPYTGRLTLFRRDRARALGGWAEENEHAFAIRYLAGADASQVRHLPYPAYLGPARAAPEPPRKLPIPRAKPKISVIIPNRDAPELIGSVLEGLLARTLYPDLEIIVVDNGSTAHETLAIYRRYASDPRLRVDIEPAAFNFSRAVNRGAAMASGEYLLLLNNDIEIESPDWLDEMESCFGFEDVGIVGAKLLYPDRTIQHAGVIAGLGDYAGHWFIGKPERHVDALGRLAARQSLGIVTGACMLISKTCWRALGGFDEQAFPIAYNDVDFCLRAGAAGFRIVWTPHATLIHHESASRGSDETPENIARFNRDKDQLQARHKTKTMQDRAYNPWCSRHDSVPRPVKLKRLPEPR